MTASTGRAPQPSPESASFRQVKGMQEEHEGGARAVVWRESGVWEFSGGVARQPETRVPRAAGGHPVGSAERGWHQL